MNKDTVIGVGLGVLIGWLLWRRRGLMSGGSLAMGGGGCAGCSGGGSSLSAGTAAGAIPGGCARAFSAGLGNYTQQSGPNRPPSF